MLFARHRDAGQSGSLSSLGSWKLDFLPLLGSGRGPLAMLPRLGVEGSRSPETCGMEPAQCLPACLRMGGGVPSQMFGLPFPYSADFTNVLI